MKADKTRRYILERAAPLFNTKGFEGTSLADLERATGLTKGALYGNFADKDALASAAFSFAMEEVKERIRNLLAPVPTFKGKLIALLEFYAQYVLTPPIAGGCPLLNTAVEADDHRVSMRSVVVKELMFVVDFIALLLENGIKAGEFRKDIDTRALAYTSFCAVEGAIMFSRVEGSREPMEIIINHLKNKLDQITCNQNA